MEIFFGSKELAQIFKGLNIKNGSISCEPRGSNPKKIGFLDGFGWETQNPNTNPKSKRKKNPKKPKSKPKKKQKSNFFWINKNQNSSQKIFFTY